MAKRFFSVEHICRKSIMVEPDLHMLIKAYAEKADVTISEALYLLVAPGLAVAQNLPYMDQIKHIREQLTTAGKI